MSASDKFKNKSQEIGGKVREAIGEAGNNDELKTQGLKDQTVSKAKQVGENLKDGAKAIKDNLNP